jgi:hypothetical protein
MNDHPLSMPPPSRRQYRLLKEAQGLLSDNGRQRRFGAAPLARRRLNAALDGIINKCEA